MKKLLYTIAFVIGIVGCGENSRKFNYFVKEKKRLAQLYYCAEDCGKWDSAQYYSNEFDRVNDSTHKYYYLMYPEKQQRFIEREKCSNCDTIQTEPRVDIIPMETK